MVLEALCTADVPFAGDCINGFRVLDGVCANMGNGDMQVLHELMGEGGGAVVM